MKILFATNNAHKLKEVQAVLGPTFELVTPHDCGVDEEIPEEQPTLEGNASQKAHYLHARTGLDCFADDTGLEVEALGGAPGVHSARYATDGHDFAANNRLLLRNLEGQTNLAAPRRRGAPLRGGGPGAHHRPRAGERGVRLRPALHPRRLRPHLRPDDHRAEERRLAPRPRGPQTGRLLAFHRKIGYLSAPFAAQRRGGGGTRT